jgi:iron complex transport system ATP-binding protein
VTLTARGVSVMRGGTPLLRRVDCDVRPGEVLAIAGANGAGKSTLLRVLAGDLAPDVGRVELDDTPLGSWCRGELARRRAVLPQHSTLSFPFTAHEVVRLGRAPFGEGNRSAEVATEALDAVGLKSLLSRRYDRLSGGERQRVHLARVLAQLWDVRPGGTTGYCLLDEPASALDPRQQQLLQEQMRAMARRGIGVVVVLHQLALAAGCATRFLLLAHGEVVASGTPREVLTPALLERTFAVPFGVVELDGVQHPLVGAATTPP